MVLALAVFKVNVFSPESAKMIPSVQAQSDAQTSCVCPLSNVVPADSARSVKSVLEGYVSLTVSVESTATVLRSPLVSREYVKKRVAVTATAIVEQASSVMPSVSAVSSR